MYGGDYVHNDLYVEFNVKQTVDFVYLFTCSHIQL